MEAETQTEPLLNVAEAARLLGISVDTLYKYAKAGLVPSVRFGDVLRFDSWTLARWIRSSHTKLDV